MEVKKPRFATAEDQERGFEVQLVDDEGDEIDFYVTVVGVDSPTYKKKSTELQRARMAQSMRKKGGGIDPRDVESDAIDLITAATRSWRGSAWPLGGEPPQFSAAAARELFTTLPQVANQVDRAISSRANFLPRSATT